ncbi:MAG: flagellar hook-basal body complex protein FliE [Armatimonadota bacterium]|nr:flagellar hook-basal body complex protein FliE [bacterium]MDW8320963.1 flagellar hook-basal body complex protein FliE [Armatimonadota bacterium]
MDIRLNTVLPGATASITGTPSSGNHDAAPSFAETLKDVFERINQTQLDSAEMTRQFASGETDDLVRVITTAEEASVALQLAVQVRNKVVEAYQEIMRMQV